MHFEKENNFAGEVYVSGILVGFICASSLSSLKRRASAMCNKRCGVVDRMVLHRVNGKDVDDKVTFTRINKLSPNKEVIRGEWK